MARTLWSFALAAAPVLAAGHALAADLPDWSGIWRTHGSVATLSSETGKPFAAETVDLAPLKPEYKAEYDRDRALAVRQGDPDAKDALTDSNTLNCFAGMPRIIASPWDYQFVITPKKVFIIADKEVRQIYTDGRDWPKEDMRWPLMLGRSRGHWEGDTLVVDTITMNPKMWTDPTPLTLSAQATVNERLRRIDAKTIEDAVTIHDPVKFTHDWTFTRHYDRHPELDAEYADDPELCGGSDDRNTIVDGKVTVRLPGQ